MPIFTAWGNIRQIYPFEHIPKNLLTDKLRCLLPSEASERVKIRYRSRWVAHFLLWQLLKTAGKPTALLAEIEYTLSGRPQFCSRQLDFSISHSGNWVAVVLNVNVLPNAVGIDIEAPQRQRDFISLLDYFAAEQEKEWFMQQHNPSDAFYRIWCLREAILKSQGVGIVKLSEVRHDPQKLRLHSAYCPSGALVFSQALPFYFGLFAAGTALSELYCFNWEKGNLKPYELTETCPALSPP